MEFFANVLRILDAQMETPEPYGWFHILSLILTFGIAVLLCATHKNASPRRVLNVVFSTAIVVAVLEIYKQVNYGFSYENGISFDMQWYAFPWQFCSTPMYVGLLAGIIRKGKVHESLCAYLATYAVFAGVCVMFYPTSVFIGTIGINIQTMICHGSMIYVGIYLLYSGYVKLNFKTLLKAIPVFAAAVAIAIVMNEIAYFSGLLETDSFNMFYISRHQPPHLPVYSLVQETVAYPWCLILYVAGFTLAASLILAIAMLIKRAVAAPAQARRKAHA